MIIAAFCVSIWNIRLCTWILFFFSMIFPLFSSSVRRVMYRGKFFAIFLSNEGLKTFKSPNPLFDQLVNYLNYRSESTTRKHTVGETGKMRSHVRRLDLILKYHKF